MEPSDVSKELKKLETIFPNKYLIDFNEAKKYINEKIGFSINDSIFENYLKEKGYRNIIKSRDGFGIEDSKKFGDFENNIININNNTDVKLEKDIVDIDQSKQQEEFDFEDMDIDDILDTELKPNSSRPSESFLSITSWTKYSGRKYKYNYSDNIRLIREYKLTKSANLLEMILELNMKLIVKQAIYYSKILSRHGLTTEDLIQEGSLGLIKAIEKFDTEKGYEFSTYAMHWVNQLIKRAICDKDMIVRLPVHLAEQVTRVMRYESKLLWQSGEINELELCSSLGITLEKYKDLKKYNYQFGSFASLDKSIGENDTELIEFIGEQNLTLITGENKEIKDPSILYEEKELKEAVIEVIETLKDRERSVIEYRFGLLDGRQRTLEEVGHIFNVTRERIRQIEVKALRRLKHPSRSKKLKIFTGADIDLVVKGEVSKVKVKEEKDFTNINKISKVPVVKDKHQNISNVQVNINGNDKSLEIRSNAAQIHSKKDKSESIMKKQQHKKKEKVKSNNKSWSKGLEKYMRKMELAHKYDEELSDILPNDIDAAINYLQDKDCKIIDLRKKRGGIWVVGSKDLDPVFEALKGKNIEFIYSEKGCLSTYYEPGWHWRKDK